EAPPGRYTVVRAGNLRRGLQDVAAHRTVAGAELVGLQGVKHPQRVRRRAADVQVRHIDVLDGAFRIDHEGGAQGDAFFLVQDAEGAGELAGVLGEVLARQVVQVRMLTAPAELGVLGIGRTAEDEGVALFELRLHARKFSDFGRTNEG